MASATVSLLPILPGDKLVLDCHVELEAPDLTVCSSFARGINEQELKEWLWREEKETILASLKVTRTVATPAPSNGVLKEQHHQKQEILEAITRVQERLLENERPRLVYGVLLEAVLQFTKCDFGLIAEVETTERGQIIVNARACTNIAWSPEVRKAYETAIEAGFQVHNMASLFGSVITTGKPVVSNDPKNDPRSGGTPPGHPTINSYLGIPFFKKGKVVGMLSLANQPGGFSEADIERLHPFIITSSLLMQVYLQIDKNEELIDSLEEKVKLRTHDLERANAKLEKANAQVIRASQLQLERFACVSHEIRTPLNCIVGLSSLLQETAVNPMQEESLRMIESSGDLLLTVVNDVLDYARLETAAVNIEVRKTNLQELLNSVVHLIALRAQPKRIKLRTFYSATMPEFVWTDGNRLQQILYNLLGNAIKFSKPSGVIELSCSLENNFSIDTDGLKNNRRSFSPAFGDSVTSDETETCSISTCDSGPALEKDQQVLCFSIKDFGKGIDKQDFDRIFQPFQQARSNEQAISGGTGLGLAVVSRLVQAKGGKLFVDSEAGEWTKFTIEIPLTIDTSVSEEDLQHELKGTSVVFIDNGDEVSPTQSTTEAVLKDLGAQCNAFKSMEEMAEARHSFEPARARVLILKENLFIAESYRRISALAPTAVLTFGPSHSVKETSGHFRSIEQTFPSVLIRSIWNAIQETSSSVPENFTFQQTPVHSVTVLPYREWQFLMAEDNKINQKVLLRLLQRLGIKNVDVVDNGQEAVDAEAAKKYDVILMDMAMPVLDGVEACRKIMKRAGGHDHPRVVFVTAHAASSYEDECRKAGGVAFLTKPVNLRALESCFHKLQESASPIAGKGTPPPGASASSRAAQATPPPTV